MLGKVMQNTSKDHIAKVLQSSWEEDSGLTLKLIFQLRDIRRGKGATIEFHVKSFQVNILKSKLYKQSFLLVFIALP